MKRKKIEKECICFFIMLVISFIVNFVGFAGNTKTVSAESNDFRPTGNATSVSVKNQTLHLEGYAFDEDCKQYALGIHVYIYQDPSDKICIGTCMAESYNLEANKNYNCGYYHGFERDITVDRTGTWNLEVYAIDMNSDGSIAGLYNPIIYSGKITFTKEPVISVSTNTLNFTSDEPISPYYISADTNGTGSYHVSSDSSWLKIATSRSKGTSKASLTSMTNGYFYVFISENTSVNDRIGILTITHASDSSKKQMITVTQTGRTLIPQVTATPTSMTAEADGSLSKNYIKVDTNSTGNYHVSSDKTWLTVGTSNSKSASGTNVTSVSNEYLYIFISENTSVTSRTGTLTITHASDSSKKQTVTVTQTGRTLIPKLTAVPTSMTAEADGSLSKNYIKVDTNSTGNYHVSSDKTWLTVGTSNSKSASETNVTSVSNEYLYIFVRENTSITSRTGTLTITHASDNSKKQTITVTQKGRTLTPQLTVEPASMTAASDGTLSQSVIKVDTNGTGNYSVYSNKTWLTVGTSSNQSFSKNSAISVENGYIYVFSKENTNASSRTATITIKHESDSSCYKTITVTQDAKKDGGGSSSDNNSDADTDSNTKTESEDSAVQIKVSPSELSTDALGKLSDNKVTVSIGSARGFSVDTGSASWLRVCKSNSSASASNKISFSSDGSFYIFAEENAGVSSRKGSITISVTSKDGNGTETKTVTVTQEAGEGKLAVDTSKITANAKGITSVSTVKVTTNKSGGFKVDNGGSSWFRVGSSNSESSASSEVSFTGDGNFYLFVSENTEDTARTGTITITHENGKLKEKITVSQQGITPVLTVNSTSKIAGQDGKFYDNKVTVDTEKTGGFTVKVEDNGWLRLSKSNTSDFSYGMTELSFTGNANFYLVASRNTGSDRSAEITITHEAGTLERTVTVTQTGTGSNYLRIDREAARFDEASEAVDNGPVTVTADEDTTWTVTTSEDWIQITKSQSLYSERYRSIEGEGTGTFYIVVKENGSYEEREGKVTISAPGQEDCEIYVYQVENEIGLVALLNEMTVRVPNKTFGVKKSTKVVRDYPEGLYPSNIKKITYTSSKPRVATVDKKGVIKAKRKGKAVITVRVQLADVNASKTFKIRITVGKRKAVIGKITSQKAQ